MLRIDVKDFLYYASVYLTANNIYLETFNNTDLENYNDTIVFFSSKYFNK